MPSTEGLTEEEKRVLEPFVLGHSVEEIAGELAISPDTVRGPVQSILTKLGVHSRLEAAALTMRPDPPSPLPPAASAALAVPFQRAEDIPRHVGRPMRRKPSRDCT